MKDDEISLKVDLPGQSDIFGVLANVDNVSGGEESGESFKELRKQISFLEDDKSVERKYTGKIEAPIYNPRGCKPHIAMLCDMMKTNQLMREIDNAYIDDAEKDFLRAAAWRHATFHYERIADYYAHASIPMRKLMERSALVIVDFDRAIEDGFVNVCEEIREQYFQEYADMKNDIPGES